jgi:hypothetical protein
MIFIFNKSIQVHLVTWNVILEYFMYFYCVSMKWDKYKSGIIQNTVPHLQLREFHSWKLPLEEYASDEY